jgi:hypothetical protein
MGIVKRLEALLEVKSIMTLALVLTACWGFVVGIVPVELFSTWVGAVITYFFTKNMKKE